MSDVKRLCALLYLLCLAACSVAEEIPVGFSGQLTGQRSDLGVQGRNGATLAVETLNAAGGVAGRKLRLLAEDDGDTPDGAVAADTALLNAGAVVIIGHMTSSQTMAAMPLLESRNAVLVSPTTATPELSGKADGFFRVIPDNRSWASALATYARNSGGVGRVVQISDRDNASYTRTFQEAFAARFTELEGDVAGEVGSSRVDLQACKLEYSIVSPK